MGRRLIEVMQVLVDQVHKGGYQHRVLEDSIYEESQRRIAAEKDRDHWRQARQEAIEAGELMKAEIETLRKELADAKRAASDEFTEQRKDAAILQGALHNVVYFRTRLEEERSVSAGLRQQLDAALALLTRERLDAGTEPTPVAEPLDAEGGA